MNIHIYIYTHMHAHIHTYIVPRMILRLFIKYSKIQFSATLRLPLFAFWKRVNMSKADMKQTAHQKHLKVCLPLDREALERITRLKMTRKTFLTIVNPGQTQTILKVLYRWIDHSTLRIAQTTTFLRIIHPGCSKTSNVFYHWIEDSRLKCFTESFCENLIEHREYWDNPRT